VQCIYDLSTNYDDTGICEILQLVVTGIVTTQHNTQVYNVLFSQSQSRLTVNT